MPLPRNRRAVVPRDPHQRPAPARRDRGRHPRPAYDPPDSPYQLEKALDAAVRQDPDCLRASLDIRLVLRTPGEVFARPGLRDKVLQLGSGWRDEPPFGPNREQLLALVSGAVEEARWDG